MKSSIMISGILVFLLILLVGCVSEITKKQPVIDKEISEKIESDLNVLVTITLVNQGSEELNLKTQDTLIEDLSDSEFKLKKKSISGRWISGDITKEGLNKLKDDSRILRIYIPKEASTFHD